MSEQTQPVKIEIEDENEPEPTAEPTPSDPTPEPSTPVIVKKKVSALTEVERAQLIQEAKAGKENEFYHVNFLKTGGVRITERKQTKAQELIKANSDNPERVALPSARYLTDQQLLFEHILNLETSFATLKAKHKKLKRRYNELEGYLYNDDDDEHTAQPAPSQQHEQPAPPQQQHEQPTPPQQTPYVQRRYVRSWRDLRPSN